METLGKEAYGFYPLSNNFVMYAGIISTALNSMAGRYITISLEQKDMQKVNVYFNSILFGNIVISLFFILLGTLFCFFIDSILHIPVTQLKDVRYLFILIFLSSIITVSSSVFSVAAFALNRLDKLAIQSIIVNILKLVIIITLFCFFTPKIYFLGLITVISSLYFFYANYKVTRRLLPEVYLSISVFSRSALMLLVGAGIWNSVLALSNVINSQLDLLIANRFFESSGMGTLSLTKFVPNSIQVLLGIIVPIFLPEMIKAYANNDKQKMKEIMSFSFKIIFLVALIPMAVFFVYGGEFFKLWLPGQDYQSLHYISILTLTPLIVHATIETANLVFIVTNKLKIASFWGISSSLLYFLLVIVLCKYSGLGLYSIPVAALFTGLISHLGFTPWYTSLCLGEKRSYFFIEMVKGLFGFVLLILISYLWKYFDLIHINSWMSFMLNMLIIGSILLIVSVTARFNKKTILYMMQKLLVRVKV